jgi:hypothetical protein
VIAFEPLSIAVEDVPPSLNAFGSGNRWRFITEKKKWQHALVGALVEADAPRGLSKVRVEGKITFPDRRRRDQGNYRFMVEKALGDALTAIGVLEDDDWSRYSFGGLEAAYEKGVRRTELMLFPS